MAGCGDGGTSGEPSSLVELIRSRADAEPDELAYTFLGEQAGDRLERTYSQLDRRVRGIAADFQSRGLEGERALLFFPPGIDFIEAFLACLYARVIAIPCALPQEKRGLSRVRKVAEDGGTRVALTVSSFSSEMERQAAKLPELSEIEWLATDEFEGAQFDEWVAPHLKRETLGYLQYTSGSTSDPKGVMVSHGNVLHNCELMKSVWQLSSSDVSLSWLPHFHDMGLLDGITLPLYLGCPCILMAPVTFIKQPFRWLEAISHYKATHSGGPNFAYELCVRKVSPEQRATLDLSSWQSAYNGSEPVRHETTTAFVECYEPVGFSPKSFSPGYGLAEATLMVSASPPDTDPAMQAFDGERLAANEAVIVPDDHPHAKPLVASGSPNFGMRAEIVAPKSCTLCPAGTIGEIWIQSLSVTGGYWERPEETERIFGAYLADTGEGPFLRTGDLGFLHEGNLYVTGRLKDMIIIDGRNIYPTDVEETVERCHRGVRPGFCAAFAHDAGDREQLVVVQELQKDTDPAQFQEIIDTIRRSVADAHDVPAHHVVLIKPGRLPKTSSGKKQRNAAREGVCTGQIEVVAQSQPPLPGEQPREAPAAPSTGSVETKASEIASNEIESWLVAQLAELLGVAADEIDSRRPFAEYGLTSRQAVGLVGDLENWLQQSLPSTLVYDFPTPETLARRLGDTAQTADATTAVVSRSADAAEPVAIVGIGCRLPGAGSVAEFWQLLRDGTDAISEVPPDRWDIDAFYDPDAEVPGKMNTRRGGFLKQVDRFDPQFFGISPREAARMDPQQRLLLEVAWEALEDAGQVPRELAGSRTGVFVGIASQDYGQMQLTDPQLSDAYAGTGSGLSIAANRLSYFFDLRGPSLAIDTACSSSLVAVHSACESLRRGESSVALAGGANVILSPVLSVNFTKAGFLAPDGRCKAFDARANGYVRAEGAGMVVLKPLSRAMADGDSIYAVIRGGAVNQDGRSNGLMAPNGRSQMAALREAHRRAAVSSAAIQYVEAHGTGTLLGDPIEANALGEVLKVDREADNPCWIGSVKTNIGHLEAAAGIAGLIKVSLMLKHRQIVPSLHFEEPNPHIAFDELPLRVPTKVHSWPNSDNEPALAGVSSFGFGGTNAHVVLEAAPPPAAAAEPAEPGRIHVLPISAHSPGALTELAGKYQQLLIAGGRNGDKSAADICRTSAVRRTHHDHRLAVVGHTREELGDRLGKLLGRKNRPGARRTNRQKLAFVFSGQGARWQSLSQNLLSREPVFRAALERCDELIGQHVDWSLWSMLNASDPNECRETEYQQPALFAVQIALAELWRSWGIAPAAVIGHSVGEVAAACVAGIISLEDATRIVVHRARLMQQAAGQGGMAVVSLPQSDTEQLLSTFGGRLSVAAVNGPATTVVSGESALLDELLGSLEKRRIAARPLQVQCAFHSAQMDPHAGELLKVLKHVDSQPGSVPMFSTIAGRELHAGEFDTDYWARNLREPVLFSATVTNMAESGFEHFLEISPHPIVCSAIRQCLRSGDRTGTAFHSLHNDHGGEEELLVNLAALYSGGFDVDWQKLSDPSSRLVKLPTYAWQRRRCWLTPAGNRTSTPPHGHSNSQDDGHPILGREIRLSKSNGRRYWEVALSPGALPDWVSGRNNGAPRITQNALHELARAAGRECYGSQSVDVTESDLTDSLALDAGEVILQVVAELAETGGLQVEIYKRVVREPSEWTSIFRAKVVPGAAGSASVASPLYDIDWKLAPLADQESASQTTTGSWIIFADQRGVATSLARQLATSGQQAILVERAQSFEAVNETRYAVDATSRGDFERVFKAVTAGESAELAGVIHLWGLDVEETESADLRQAQLLTCDSAAFTVQAALALPIENRPGIRFVTAGSQTLPGDAFAPAVLQSPLWGLGRAWSYEQSDIWGGLLDVDPSAPVEDMARSIVQEVLFGDDEDQVAFRGTDRYAPRLVQRSVSDEETPPLKADGCYLITGGLGGLGLEVASDFARRGARKLVLSGRSAIPPRSQWDTLKEDEHWGPRLRRIQELESTGVEVKPVSVDVADQPALAQLQQELETEGWSPVRGIVHAAGVMQESRLAELDAELLSEMLKPKVAGALALERTFAGGALDFFVCFSSASSLLGVLGQGVSAYAAANAFLDSFVQRLRQRGINAVGINWSMWADVGRAADDAGVARLKRRGFEPVTVEQGLQVLADQIAASQSQTLVLPVDWSRVIKGFPAIARTPIFRDVVPREAATPSSGLPSAPTLKPVELLGLAREQRKGRLIEHLTQVSAPLLGMAASELEVELPLNQLGFDSLMAMELKNRIQSDFGIRVSIVAILDGLSLVELSAQVSERLEKSGHRSRSPKQAPPEPAAKGQHSAGANTSMLELAADRGTTAEDELTRRIEELSEQTVDALLEQMLNEKNAPE